MGLFQAKRLIVVIRPVLRNLIFGIYSPLYILGPPSRYFETGTIIIYSDNFLSANIVNMFMSWRMLFFILRAYGTKSFPTFVNHSKGGLNIHFPEKTEIFFPLYRLSQLNTIRKIKI